MYLPEKFVLEIKQVQNVIFVDRPELKSLGQTDFVRFGQVVVELIED